MVEAEKRGSSYWWWLDSHDKGKRNLSPWLQSTLSELDEKTKTMLKLIEEEADSFARRAEMYYNKRPEIISMLEDFYRAHRSLAERYDQVKSESCPRLLTARSSPLPFAKHHLDNVYDSNFDTYQPEGSDESEINNPEEEETEQDHTVSQIEEVLSGSCNEELVKLRDELERLREENKIQKEQLIQKDEEKRNVIRQLSLAMDLLKEENLKLGQCVAEKNLKKESPQELNKLKGHFLGRLFSGLGKS